MATKATRVELKGVARLVRELKRAGADDLLDALKAANAEAAQSVEAKARPDVPQVSGSLAGSLRSSATPRAGVVRIGKARVPYAGPVHFGWPARGIEPQPFLYDALDDRFGDVTEAYARRIDRLADSITGEA